GSSYNALDVTRSGTALTISSGITIEGEAGYVGYDPSLGGSSNVTVVNQGTINADVSGGTIYLLDISLQGNGSYDEANGGVLSLAGDTLNAVTLNGAVTVTRND